MNDAWKPRSSWRLDKLAAADAVCLDGSPAVMYRRTLPLVTHACSARSARRAARRLARLHRAEHRRSPAAHLCPERWRGRVQTTNCTAVEVGLSSCVRHFAPYRRPTRRRPVHPRPDGPAACVACDDRRRTPRAPALRRSGTAARSPLRYPLRRRPRIGGSARRWRPLREAVRSWWDSAADAPPSARVDRCRPRWARSAAQPSCLRSCGRVGSGGGDDRPALLERAAQVTAALRAAGWEPSFELITL